MAIDDNLKEIFGEIHAPLTEQDYLNPAFVRIINKKKSKYFPTASYSVFTGKLLGYLESDEHFRQRIKDGLNDNN